MKEVTIDGIKPVEANIRPDEHTEKSINDSNKNQDLYVTERLRHLSAYSSYQETYNQTLTIYNKALQSECTDRRRYGWIIIAAVGVYVVYVLYLIQTELFLSDQVLIALLTSTSINIIGLSAIVIRYLFSNNHHKILDNHFKVSEHISRQYSQ